MNLKELLEQVKEKSLTKEQIEEYFDALTHVYSAVCIELAELKKQEALYFLDHMQADVSDVSIKRNWRGTKEGQRMLELEAYKNVIPKELASLRNRIYSFL